MNDKMRQQLLAIIGEEDNIEVEIDQKLYPRPDWAVDQIVRASGVIEDISKSGCGHPNAGFLAIHDPDGSKMLGVHCCDGACCQTSDEESEPFQELWDDDLRKRARKDYDERSNTPSIESGRCDKT